MSSIGAVEQTAGKGAARYAERRRNRATGVGSNRRGGWVTYTILTVVLLISFYPIYYTFLLASSDAITIAQNPIPSLIPEGNFIDNVTRVINSDIKFWQALVNSIIVAVITSISVVLFATLAGFAFAKLRFRGRRALLVFVIATMAVPDPARRRAAVHPDVQPRLDRQARGRHRPRDGHRLRRLLDDPVLRGVPALRADRGRPRRRMLDDPHVLARRPAGSAARQPRCSRCSRSSPRGPASSGRSSCSGSTNPTLPVSLQLLQASYFKDIALIMAGVVLATIPLILLFFVAGKQLVSGIMAGAVKG